MTRVLVTGGRGFVGGYVVDELILGGFDVVVMSNMSHPSRRTMGREYVYGDIRYYYDVKRIIHDVDLVIHLAAKINVDRSRESAEPFFDTNIKGTFNILEACRKYNKKLVYASTSEALGSMQIEPMDELHPFSPDNPYGATKASADMLVLGWIKAYGIDATILRSFNITGVGQSFDKEGAFIPKVIESILNDENPKIFGSGKQTRDYVWVKDVAKAYVLLAKGDYSGEVFHVGTDTEVSIEYVAQKLIEISGKSLHIEYLPSRPMEVKRLRCNYSKIAKLGWKPEKYIDAILEDMYGERFMREMSHVG